VFGDLGFDCDTGLWDDLVNADAGNGYVNACNGHWATSHENERLSDSWSYFEDTVKHRTRFNFASLDGDEYMGSQDIPPRYMLETLGDLLQPVVTTLAVHTSVYRVRSRTVRKTWEPDAQQMGAPNPEIATAGRMNPAGIPYLYTAFDFNTAVHEARAESRTTSTVFVGRFETTQPLVLVDFTASFDMPSLFDLNRQRERENILFFYRFVEQISQPVRPDDRVHLSYIPTQVVCEYLAQVFQTNEGKQLDGIIFPSSLFKGGKNLVVFPSKERGRLDFRGVNFKEVFRYQRPRRQHPTGPFDQPTGRLLPMM
jgi:RES domain-containing protein